jgi:hypothetical protein
MAHFAEIDENKVVLRVVVTDTDDPNGDEGYQWLIDNLGGTWIKTSYNARIRKNFAQPGYLYDEELDAFIPPKDHESFIFDPNIARWIPPIPKPDDGQNYNWNEENQVWQASL